MESTSSPSATVTMTLAAPATTPAAGYGGHYADHSGCSPSMINGKMMKYSPTSTYSSPSPPGGVHRGQQLVEHQHQGPSATLHHYSSAYNGAAAADMYSNVCAAQTLPPPPPPPPSYEQSVVHGSDTLHHHWYPTAVMSAHHQQTAAAAAAVADGLQ